MKRLIAGVLLAGCGGMSTGVDAGKPPPKLSGVPDCGTPADAGTAADLYATIVFSTGCASGGCHHPSSFNVFAFDDPASFRAKMLEKSVQAPELNRVTPRDIHQSYLVYKLMGQHLDAGFEGFGVRMPQDGPYLTDPELCSVINWVNAGAP
jgi:hypothetical protein